MRGWMMHRKGLAVGVMAMCLFVSVNARAQEAPPAGGGVALSAASGQKTESAFKFREMVARGWPILSVLLVMSIVSLGIIIERVIVVKRTERDAGEFLPDVLKAVEEGKPAKEILEHCDRTAHPIASVVARVMAELGDREAMERASIRALQLKVNDLERRVPALGTIASTAPFVGLLGTVIGIIKAFQSIASHMGGGPEVVAGGVAEALITTAFGLFVAIPAVMGYNHLVNRVQRLSMEVDVNVSEIIEKISKRK